MTRLLSVVLFVFLSHSLHAQHYSPPPNFHYTPPTPKIGPGSSYWLWNIASRNRENSIVEISRKHSFSVVMKDSTELVVDGKIECDSASGAYYLLWTDKKMKRSDSGRIKRIYPAQTNYISRLNGDGQPDFVGFSTDSCWLFPVIAGKLNVYAAIAEEDLTEAYFLFLRKGEGPIVEFSEENLEEAMTDKEKALVLLKKRQYKKAIAKYND
jgi:hypothetical protein